MSEKFLEEFFERARREMFPKMRSSALSVTIVGDPDPKLCMELGAAILFDKPIICVVPRGRIVPANLRRVASSIVEGDIEDDSTKDRLQAAIESVIETIERAKKQ